MKNSKSHFVLNRSQQNGIFILATLIVVFQLIYLFYDASEDYEIDENAEVKIEKFQKQIDSLKIAQIEADTIRIFPFNPNFITDYRGFTLGMSVEEIDKIIAYRAQDKWVNSSAEFQEVTGVSDSLLAKIEVYFRFPDWVASNNQTASRTITKPNTNSSKSDLNSVTALELQEINGIGEVLSQRIINYRNRIGEFKSDLQLKDIYGLNYELREKIVEKFTVLQVKEISKININTASVTQLAEIPYFNYELAREIINYRLLNEGISNFEELAKINDFPSDKIDRIELYLTLE